MTAPDNLAIAMAAHADHLEHTAAVGGYVREDGRRVLLDQATRERWARDAALFRQLALDGGAGALPPAPETIAYRDQWPQSASYQEANA